MSKEFTVYKRTITRDDSTKVTLEFYYSRIKGMREYVVSVEYLTVEHSEFSNTRHISRETEIHVFENRADASHELHFLTLMHFNSIPA